MSEGLNAWTCKGCGAVYFPERYLCVKCGSPDFETVLVEGPRTPDVGGTANTGDVGKAIAEAI